LGRGGGICGGGNISTAGPVLGGELTGLPHFRQNWASSGRLAPHLLHPKSTLAGGGVVLSVGILTGSPRYGKREPSEGFCVRTRRDQSAKIENVSRY
jgi:hypothetical protein